MDRKFVTIGFILACSLIFIVGYQGGKTSLEEKVIDLQDQNQDLKVKLQESSKDVFRLQKAKEKLSSFTDRELEELRNLKDQKQQYQKIDEMMGKMMLMLLADLGIKLSQENRQYLKKKSLGEELPEDKLPSNEKINPSVMEKEKLSEVDTDLEDKNWGINQEEEIFFPPNTPQQIVENTKRTLKQKARRFQTFRNVFNTNIRDLLPNSTVYKALFRNKQFKGEQQAAPDHLVSFYLKEAKGEFRRGSKTKQKVDYQLIKLNKKTPLKALPIYGLNLNTRSKKTSSIIHIQGEFSATHSSSHRNDGNGPCQFLVLSQLEGPLQLYLTNISIRGKKSIFGKVLNSKNKKYPTVGYFYLQ